MNRGAFPACNLDGGKNGNISHGHSNLKANFQRCIAWILPVSPEIAFLSCFLSQVPPVEIPCPLSLGKWSTRVDLENIFSLKNIFIFPCFYLILFIFICFWGTIFFFLVCDLIGINILWKLLVTINNKKKKDKWKICFCDELYVLIMKKR